MVKEIIERFKQKQIVECLARLRGRLRLWKKICFILLLVTIVALIFTIRGLIKEYEIGLKVSRIERSTPHSEEIKKIINSLQYSAFYHIMDPNVRIDLDFKNGLWCLRNIRHFNSEGKIVLYVGRSGICNELAVYVYDKIRPLFGDEYQIEFVRCTESSFFINPTATHVVLRITKPDILFPHVYIIDPSFRRYGPLEEFEDYMFYETMDYSFLTDSSITDQFYPISRTFPLLIKKNFLLQLTVESNSGKFDKDNFVVALTATKRHRYAGRYIFALRKNKGKAEQFENRALVREVLSKGEYNRLYNRLEQLFNQLLIQTGS